MRFSLHLLAVVILSTIVMMVGAADKPSCLGYSKGAYTGNVTSQAECRTACEVAEGMQAPDFKTSTCTNNGTNNNNYICDCKTCDSTNSNCERRGLCVDTNCDVSGGKAGSVMMIGLIVVLVASFM